MEKSVAQQMLLEELRCWLPFTIWRMLPAISGRKHCAIVPFLSHDFVDAFCNLSRI